jgi:ferritin-like metal-binding protein YciE
VEEFTMKLESIKDLYVEELKDLHDAENQILQALPKMAKAASAPELRAAFEEHQRQTQGQVERLDRIFQQLGARPEGKKCKGVAGLLAEGDELMKEEAEPEVRDAGLIAGAQKVEHYEIAGYGTVRTYAQLLGETEAARLLQQTLDEEGEILLRRLLRPRQRQPVDHVRPQPDELQPPLRVLDLVRGAAPEGRQV